MTLIDQLTPVADPTTGVKQIIIVRKDLFGRKDRRGKMAAQVAHASVAFLTKRLRHTGQITIGFLPEAMQNWIDDSFTKIVVWVENQEEFHRITQAANAAGLECHAILDQGRTCFDGPTWTCAAIGPDLAEKLDPVTRHLKLVK